MDVIAWLVVGLVLAKWLAEWGLSALNRRHVLAQARRLPEALRDVMDEATQAKAVRYTLARLRFGRVADTCQTVVLLTALFSGVLPWAIGWFAQHFGSSVWSAAAFLFSVAVGLSLTGLPLDWIEQFNLEERFGFNTSTQRTWWLDRIKGLLLALGLGYPLLVLMLKLVEWTGAEWWLWAWAALMVFQLLMLVLAPVLILPLFNRFTPLPDGTLRDRLVRLAERTQFRARSIQVMDGSRRSRHSNAFFTGFGRFRRIVLFDTLIAQLAEAELEAVLAHEIGHYKLRHIPKMFAGVALGSLAGFWALSVLARQDWFYQAFGIEPGNVALALLIFALLAGVATFWLSPVIHFLMRRHEYQADAFAADVMGEAQSLIGALRKLSEKNLANLTPHPVYSGFYYSHPTLFEREKALHDLANGHNWPK